jgi:hypothetical protein
MSNSEILREPVLIATPGYKGLAEFIEKFGVKCNVATARRKVKKHHITKYKQNHQVISFSVSEVYFKVILGKEM